MGLSLAMGLGVVEVEAGMTGLQGAGQQHHSHRRPAMPSCETRLKYVRTIRRDLDLCLLPVVSSAIARPCRQAVSPKKDAYVGKPSLG